MRFYFFWVSLLFLPFFSKAQTIDTSDIKLEITSKESPASIDNCYSNRYRKEPIHPIDYEIGNSRETLIDNKKIKVSIATE